MTKLLSLAAGIGALALGAEARAQDDTTPPCPAPCPAPSPPPATTYQPSPSTTYESPPVAAEEQHDPYSYAWSEPGMLWGIGVGVVVGGGISWFADSAMQDVSRDDIGGLWDLRVTIGSHIPIGVDVSYLGTATGLQTFGGFDNGTLIGTNLEAAARWNILPHYEWNPYVFGGIGWQRFDVTSQQFSTADTGMSDSDNSVVFPMGVGIDYRDPTGLVVDLRGTFRAVTNNDLLIEPNGNGADLHWWEASAAVGYEF